MKKSDISPFFVDSERILSGGPGSKSGLVACARMPHTLKFGTSVNFLNTFRVWQSSLMRVEIYFGVAN